MRTKFLKYTIIGAILIATFSSCSPDDNVCEDCYFVDVNGQLETVCITYNCLTDEPR